MNDSELLMKQAKDAVDLVKRLRVGNPLVCCNGLCDEAADRIEDQADTILHAADDCRSMHKRIKELEERLKNETAHEFYESSGDKPPESL